MMQRNDIIIVDSLEKSYKDLKVLKGISFTVEKGSIFALLGSNGAGKTTTVNILSTLMRPDGGKAAICGFDTVRQGGQVREHISLTGQYAAVDEFLTGRENLRMMTALRHIPGGKERAESLLKSFRLSDAANRRVSSYSGGMRRRLDLAMSLIGEPDVIFLDEPTTGLDPQSRLSLWNVIRSLADSGTTVFLTTQYLEEAEQLADRIAILHNGKFAAEGTPAELKRMFSQGTMELLFPDPRQMEKAYTLLKEYAPRRDDALLLIHVAADGGIRQSAELLNLLNDAHISLTGFSQKLPSLEDVFLKLITENKEESYP